MLMLKLCSLALHKNVDIDQNFLVTMISYKETQSSLVIPLSILPCNLSLTSEQPHSFVEVQN